MKPFEPCLAPMPGFPDHECLSRKGHDNHGPLSSPHAFDFHIGEYGNSAVVEIEWDADGVRAHWWGGVVPYEGDLTELLGDW